MEIRKVISLLAITILTGCFSTFSSCSKEYSCEDCLITDTDTPIDSLPNDIIIEDTAKIDTTLKLTPCNNCDSTQPLALNSWSLKTNNSYTCGTVENAGFDTEKFSFDFGGYLKCSRDTGFRIVAFFYPLTFTEDRVNVSTTSQSFIFQDQINYMNGWAGYILHTDGTTPQNTIKVVVDTFYNSTKLMVGRFYGYAYTKNNEKSYVEGKFRFIVH
jgi:hypothetical protein